MINFYKEVFSIIKGFGLKQFYLLILFFTILPFIELLGITSLFGYIKIILTNEESFFSNSINNIFKFKNNKNYFLYFSFIVLFLIIIRNFYIIFFSWFKSNYFAYLGNFLSEKLLKNYFDQEYNFFLKNNSSVLVKNINEETHVFSNGFLSSLVEILSSIAVTVVMLVFIFNYNFKISIISILVLGIFYIFYYNLTKYRFISLGEEKLENNNLRFQNVSQAMQGIKEIKIFNIENFFLRICTKYFKNSARIIVNKFVLSLLPRYIIEIIVFSAIVLSFYYNIKNGQSINSILEVLTLYIIVGYRILPYLEKLFQSVSNIRFSMATVKLIKNQLELKKKIENNKSLNKIKKIKFDKNINLENISFSFNLNEKILNNINISINKNDFIAIVGKTGSGKSTLLNILLGLLEATGGKFNVDGVIIDKSNYKIWQKSLGYVPQDVYLFEDTIYNNISLFKDKNEEVNKKTIEAAKKAEVFDFINGLKKQFDTMLEERGVNLSGGQKQRLAIARAIYVDPEILIFDEATSNLDNETSNSLVKTFENLKKLKKTIILVTHDINLVKNCDKIIFLKKGNIIAEGTYNNLINESSDFKKLIDQ